MARAHRKFWRGGPGSMGILNGGLRTRPSFTLPAALDYQAVAGGLPDRVAMPVVDLERRTISPCPTVLRGRPCGKTVVFRYGDTWRCPRCGHAWEPA